MILGKCGRVYCPSSKENYLLIAYSNVCKILVDLNEEKVLSLADLSLPQFTKPTAFFGEGVGASPHSMYSRFGLHTTGGMEYYGFRLLPSRSYTPSLSAILKGITEHKAFLESLADKMTSANVFVSSLDFVADTNYKLVDSKFTFTEDDFFSYDLEFLAGENDSVSFQLEFSSRASSYMMKTSVKMLEGHLKLYLSCNSQGVFLQHQNVGKELIEGSPVVPSLGFNKEFKILESPSKWSEREQLIKDSKQCLVRCADDGKIYRILDVASKFGDVTKEVVTFSLLTGDEVFYAPLSSFISESQDTNSVQKYNFQLIEFI